MSDGLHLFIPVREGYLPTVSELEPIAKAALSIALSERAALMERNEPDCGPSCTDCRDDKREALG